MQRSLSIILTIAAWQLSVPLYAQTWQPLGTGMNWEVRTLFADTIENVLYAGGGFKLADGLLVDGIGKWDGVKWDSLGSGVDVFFSWPNISNVLAITEYNGNLYAGGAFDSIGGITAKGIAKWDDTNWNSVGTGSKVGDWGFSVWGLLVHDNELYAMGNFDSIGGIPAYKIARWNDTAWTSFPVLDNIVGGWGIADAVFYKGEMYVGGNFPGTAGPNMADIAKWDGVSWQSVGNGLTGFFTHINTFAVYKDTLYVGGLFFEADGDPGNCIVKWDGNAWSDVGGGMNAQVFELIVFNGELWAGGQFSSAGGVPVTFIAKWDGTQWYNIGADFDNGIGSFAVLNNELYAGGGFKTINGDSISRIAKYNPDTTTSSTSLVSHSFDVKIYPNPGKGIVTLQINIHEKQNVTVEVFNIIGEKVYNQAFYSSYGIEKKQIDIEELEKGIYLMQVIIGKKVINKKFIHLPQDN